MFYVFQNLLPLQISYSSHQSDLVFLRGILFSFDIHVILLTYIILNINLFARVGLKQKMQNFNSF